MPSSVERMTDIGLTCRFGGAEGIRTPDLLVANETRYQLRHSPVARGRTRSEQKTYHPAALVPESGGPRRRAAAPHGKGMPTMVNSPWGASLYPGTRAPW